MAEPIAFPASIPIKQLQITHPEYDADRLRLHSDLYAGGPQFDENKDKYLPKRALEETHQGNGLRKARLKSARYTPHLAGIVQNLVAGSLQAPPRIECKGTSAKLEYWKSLNTNTDGQGHDLLELATSRILRMMLDRRSFIAINAVDVEPEEADEATDLARARTLKTIDARLTPLDAASVDDWSEDDRGNLEWIRTHTVSLERSMAFGPVDIERHCWCFVTDSVIQEYTATRKRGERVWPADEVARAEAPKPHDLGVLPVIKVEAEGLYVANSLSEPALSLFAREASLNYALDSSAYALMILFTMKKLDKIVGSEVGAIVLDKDDKFQWASPDSGHFAALQSNCVYQKQCMFQAVQSMYLEAASRQSNGRMSGLAKQIDLQPVTSLLAVFGSALRDAFEKGFRIIQKARGDEDVTVSLMGLDRFDAMGLPMLMEQAKNYIELPHPPSAEKYLAEKYSLSICADAPDEVREQIKKECGDGLFVTSKSISENEPEVDSETTSESPSVTE